MTTGERSSARSGRGVDWSLLERPMGPRSVVASLLLGRRPPSMRAALLVRWCEALGFSENATRVALSRMVERGELLAADGRYELSGTFRILQALQDWAVTDALRPWNGEWTLVVAGADRRAAVDRAAFRAAARAARLAPLRDGVWGRPDNLPAHVGAEAWALLAGQATRWVGRPEPSPDCVALFGLSPWRARAELLLERLAATAAEITARPAELGRGFVVSAAIVQHLRRDARLPAGLLPAGWPGGELRAGYQAYRPAFLAAATEYLNA